MGSLAVISEVSFKLRAAWESTATAELRLDDAHAGAAMIDAIRRGPTEPIALVWCGPENRIAVRFGEHPSAVAWQMDQLPAADWKRFDRESESVVWEAVRSHYEQMPGTVARVAVLPAAVAGVIERFRPSHWLVHGTIGTAMMTIDPEVVRGLRAEFPSVLERAPIDVRERIPWFGVGPTDYDLMRKMKDAFDPDHRLNPGRHVDGEPGGQPET
jgi:glycolate oxidase FAD binding subunit